MPFLKWDESFDLSIPAIDVRHRLIFLIIEDFLLEYLRGRPKEAIDHILKLLSDYIEEDFQLEERYMDDYLYPGYLPHKEKHVQFIQNLSDLKNKIEGNKSEFVAAFNDIVCGWLKSHILEVDKPLVEFLKPKIN
ncbi:MAG: hemerythrin family protein [Nitrospinae bacterium]|nr:hemerythrin family protein [Nitrospinota bacterium]MBI3813697.1 hemerythrin family protein [Nitrospinota bacterium]